MTRHEKEITREQYQMGVENRGYLPESACVEVFTEAERWGYGVYSPVVHERDERFYVSYLLGSTCD